MKKYTVLFLLLTLFSCPAFAQEGLSLEQALRIAFAKNPRMMEAREEISASKGKWIQAEALPNPQAELEIGGLKKDEEGSRNSGVDTFSIKQPLDPLGTRFLRGRMAHDEVNIAKDTLSLVWSETASQIIETYSRILAEEKAAEVAEQNLKTTRQFFTQVEGRFQAGNARQSDLLRAKIETSKAENEVLISQKNLKVFKGELNLSLGNPAEAPLALSDVLSYEPLQYEYKSLVEKALSQRPDVEIEKTRLSSRKKGVWSAFLETVFPKMAIGVQRTTADYENDTAILLEASYPLWGFNLGKVKEARAEKVKQEIHFEAFKNEVGLDVYKAFLEAELADKQVLLNKKSLDEANELLRQVTTQYEEGDIQFLSYLENIKTIKESRLSYFNALKTFKQRVTELEKAIQTIAPPQGEKLP